VNDYSLSAPTKAQFVLVYFTLPGFYMFRPFAIFRKLTAEQLRTLSNKIFQIR
jgi:hypothetical protein